MMEKIFSARLFEITPAGEGREFFLEKDENILGRDEKADLVFPVGNVSRLHARISRSAQGYFICDLDSHNGTYLNGQQINADPVLLKDKDQIVLGGAVALRFYDPSQTSSGVNIGKLVGLWVDEKNLEVWVDARKIDPPLSAAQYKLLLLLYQSGDRLISREEIIKTVWPDVDSRGVSEDSINSLIKRLKARLLETSPREYLEVIRGQGIRLKSQD